MNAEDAHPDEDSILTRLLACDEALAAGTPPLQPADAETPVQWQPRLQGDLACIQVLRQVLPRRATGEPAALAAGLGDPPTSETTVPPDLPFQQLGRFQLRRLLGQGAFGMVFLAADPQLGRAVALKVPRPEALLTGELRERFVREARAAAGLDHPNLVPVYEAGAVGPLCYIASAYCPGITLAQWLKSRSELAPERLAATLVATLADAVSHAHSRGVIHRDLKPSNVLLQERRREAADAHSTVKVSSGVTDSAIEEEFIPRITDFGLAKLTADASSLMGDAAGVETRTGAVLGTPNYMAPEQASGKNKEVGPAADIYALGAILYELLTGRPPFRGESPIDTLDQVRSRDPLPPGRLRPKLARDLDTICLKCLQKEPHKRYASASALADDLCRFLAGEPIQARPIRVWERGLKWARRHPVLATLADAGITLAVVVMCYSVVLAESNTQLKDRNSQLEEMKAALEKSNTQLQKTNEELKHQRDQAREVAVHAEQSLDETFTTLQQDWTKGNLFTMARIGASPELRKANPQHQKFLYKQLDFCQKFLQKYDRDPGPRREAGRTYSIIGEINYLLLRYGEAEQAFGKALERQQKLVDEFPDQVQYKDDLLWSHHDLYFTYMDRADMNRAEAVLKKILAIREKLIRDNPAMFAYYLDQSNSYYELGDCYRRSGKEKECLEAHRHRARMWEKAYSDHSSNTDFAVQLAQSYDWIGGWMNEHDQTKEGLQWRDRAIGTLEAVLKKEPRNYPIRLTLRNSHSGRAWTFENLGRYPEALADWTRAIELDGAMVTREVAVDAYRMYCARIMARMGDHAKAATEVQALIARPWANEFRLREAINVFALSSSAAQRDAKLPEAEGGKLAERYASRAADCLKRARDAGFFGYDTAARIDNLRKDKDLATLRERKDFQTLMLSLQPKNQQKKTP